MTTAPPSPLDRLERLVRSIPALVSESRLDRVLQQVADLARDLLGCRYSAIGLLAPDQTTLASFTTSGISAEHRARIGAAPVGRGVLGLVIREGRIIRLPDLSRHPASVGFPAHHPPMKSFLGVPILGPEGVIGDLYLTEKQDADEFSDADVHLAQLLAGIVARTVENARSHERAAQLLEEVQQLHRSRERFFAMVNHELRNALAAVYGWAEMLVRKKDVQSVPRGAFEVLEAAEQAVALVNDLLDLSRLDEDRLKPVLRDVDCSTLVRSAIARVMPSADEKNVRLITSGAGKPRPCRTDPHRVEQILVNLLTNAIRHTPDGSTVTVHAAGTDSGLELAVEDEGPGIGPDEADRIFEIFYTTAGQVGLGHGIGLPLSRRLARLLGGELVAEPRQGGGRFVLRLPGQS